MSRPTSLSVGAYLLPAAIQGLLGFVVIAAIASQLGTPGLATFGIQQLVFQILTLSFSLGFPSLVAAQSVKGLHDVGVSHIFSISLGTISLLSTITALLLFTRDVVLGPSTWPLIAASAGVAALTQTLAGRLRGFELHIRNSLFLSFNWTAAYGLGVTFLIVSDSLHRYWLGLLCGTASVLAVGLFTLAFERPRLPRLRHLQILKAAAFSLPHSLGNLLMTGVLRPIAGLIAGAPGVAAMTVATQFAQAAVVIHQAYWSSHTQSAIRALEQGSKADLHALGRRSFVFMLTVWALGSIAAPFAIPVIAGDQATRTMVALSVLLCGVPVASVIYDLHAGTLWRTSRTTVLSMITLAGLALTLGLALAAGHFGLMALPLALLASRATQGFMVRRAVRRTCA